MSAEGPIRAKLMAVDGGAESKPSSANPDDHPVTFTTTGKTRKLVLPKTPAYDDHAALAAWLTSVLGLDRRHPVTGAAHEGLRGPEGHVVIRRADAADIRFEPAIAMNTARRLRQTLMWQLLPTDAAPYGFKDEHANHIAHVARLLSGTSNAASEAQETSVIVGTFLADAEPLEGLTTYGSTGERYEALAALKQDIDSLTGRPIGASRYLIDANTGEFVIRVGDLMATARRLLGVPLAHGWLDARMDNLGWTRLTVQGYQQPGAGGRRGPHLRAGVYRGVLPWDDEADDEALNT